MPPAPPPATEPKPDVPPPAPAPAFAAAWGPWIAVGGAVLLAAAGFALATGQAALGDALDVGRWFR
jgi:hypothetical protein